VDCNDAAAKYRVVGIVQGKKSDEVDPNKDCAQWDTASAGIWFGEPGEPGKVLCVETVTK
ncbi:MAG TPA: hypothetical protein VF163_00950, partial [Micromonosporaceae bacterium]